MKALTKFELYSSKRVKEMFEQNSVPFCDKDGVIFEVAMVLFGAEAFELAFTNRSEGDIETFSECGKSLSEQFFTYQGFRFIATCANILDIQKKRGDSKMVDLPGL